MLRVRVCRARGGGPSGAGSSAWRRGARSGAAQSIQPAGDPSGEAGGGADPGGAEWALPLLGRGGAAAWGGLLLPLLLQFPRARLPRWLQRV